jgi:ATP-binding cassette, subfamily B, bacterial
MSGAFAEGAWRRLHALPAAMLATTALFSRGLRLATAAAPLAAGTYLSLAILLNALGVLQVWLTRSVVNTLLSNQPSDALLPAAFYVLTLLVPAMGDAVQLTMMAWPMDRAVGAVDTQIMAAGARIPDLTRIEGGAFGDEVRLLQEAHNHAPRLVQALPQLIGGVVTLAGLLILLGRLQPLLPYALVLSSVPHILAERRISSLKYFAFNARSRSAREMDYSLRVMTDPATAKELRIFGQHAFFLARFRDRFAQMLVEGDRARRAELRLSLLSTGTQALTLAGGFWYVAIQASSGRLTLGDIALYLGAVSQVETLLFRVVIQYRNVSRTLLHLGGLFAFLDGAGPTIAVASSATARPVPETLETGIELRGVTFRYPNSDRTVLEEVSALLPAGKVTALVGVNGAGKSTLAKLLTRMYDPTAGTILLDGAPLAAYDLETLRRRIAVAYQDFARFALSLAENVTVGAVDGRGAVSLAMAAQWAGVDAIAAKLPRGYGTELTRRFEGGVDLSGGEWQKVALARAFIRDAALVILDEPTAALDADAEYHLFQQFRTLIAGKTALVISHRFSTVRMADHILVLEDGRISEAGSHADLLARGDRYAALYEMQAGRYR